MDMLTLHARQARRDWSAMDQFLRNRPPTPPGHDGGSRIVSALEDTYEAIRRHHPELPDVVIITGSGLDARGLRWGHFARDRWVDALRAGRRPALFVAGERLATGAELTLQTMLHEAGHGLACVRGVKDCTRQGRYHNGRFLAISRELGLDYTHGTPDPTIGYSAVTLTDEACRRYAVPLARLARAITLHLDNPLALLGDPTGGTLGGHGGRIGGARRTKGTGGGRTVRAVCACEPARIIRLKAPASRMVALPGVGAS